MKQRRSRQTSMNFDQIKSRRHRKAKQALTLSELSPQVVQPISQACFGSCSDDPKKQLYLTTLNNHLSNESIRLCISTMFQQVQTDITPHMRQTVIDWSLELISSFDLNLLTYVITVQLFDRYLSVKPVKRLQLQETGIACAFLSQILMNDYTDRIADWADMADGAVTSQGLKERCVDVANTLGFKLMEPTLFHLLNLLVKITEDERLKNFSNTRISFETQPGLINLTQILSIVLPNIEFACLPPSLQLAGILYLIGPWDQRICTLLHKTEQQAMECSLFIKSIYKDLYSNGIAKVASRGQNLITFTDHVTKIYPEIREISDLEAKRTITFLKQSLIQTVQKETPLPIISKDVYEARYTQISELGKGSFGTVIHVKDNTTDVEYALKVMKFDCVEGEFLINFRNMVYEMCSFFYLSGLKGLMEVDNAFRVLETSSFILVIKLYEKDFQICVNLAKRDSPEDCEYIRRLSKGFFEGLTSLHSRGFVHLDIKPKNILVGSDMKTSVADFGLTRLYTEGMRSVAYTENYRDPEIFMGGKIGWWSDMWAAGATLVCVWLSYGAGFAIDKQFREYLNEMIIQSRLDGIQIQPQNEISAMNHIFKNSNSKFRARCLKTLAVRMISWIEDAGGDQGNLELADLLRHLLCPSEERWTAAQCLQHPFFATI